MKYFVFSDVHSFYDEFITALNKAGYDENNPEHKLISCGDNFDRGEKSKEMYNFILHQMKLDKIVLIRGNHETLMRDLINRQYPQSHDYSNGTVKTVLQFGGVYDNTVYPYFSEEEWITGLKASKKKTNFLEPHYLNYYETKHYIMVHSWIPVKYEMYDLNPELGRNSILSSRVVYKPGWRYASDGEWEEATWGNPYKMAWAKTNKTGKTIIFGHFHTSYYWSRIKCDKYDEWGERACFKIAKDKEDNFIAIDACTAHTHNVNILVIEDEELEYNE